MTTLIDRLATTHRITAEETEELRRRDVEASSRAPTPPASEVRMSEERLALLGGLQVNGRLTHSEGAEILTELRASRTSEAVLQVRNEGLKSGCDVLRAERNALRPKAAAYDAITATESADEGERLGRVVYEAQGGRAIRWPELTDGTREHHSRVGLAVSHAVLAGQVSDAGMKAAAECWETYDLDREEVPLTEALRAAILASAVAKVGDVEPTRKIAIECNDATAGQLLAIAASREDELRTKLDQALAEKAEAEDASASAGLRIDELTARVRAQSAEFEALRRVATACRRWEAGDSGYLPELHQALAALPAQPAPAAPVDAAPSLREVDPQSNIITIVIARDGTVQGDLDDAQALWPNDQAELCGQTVDGQARSILEQALQLILVADLTRKPAPVAAAKPVAAVTRVGMAIYDKTNKCRACGQTLVMANYRVADGCPCNTERGINHGLVPLLTCTCAECDPAQTGSTRYAAPYADAPTPVPEASRVEAVEEDPCPLTFEQLTNMSKTAWYGDKLALWLYRRDAKKEERIEALEFAENLEWQDRIEKRLAELEKGVELPRELHLEPGSQRWIAAVVLCLEKFAAPRGGAK